MRHRQSWLALVVALVTLSGASNKASATVYLSNLDYPLPSGGGIGDIEGVSSDNEYSAHFTTGAGSSYDVTGITLEFYPAAFLPGDLLSIQLSRVSDGVILGSFGNPAFDPKPSPWPDYSSFVDFSPGAPISLDPSTKYTLAVTCLPGGSVDIFFTNFSYTNQAGWTMQRTTFTSGGFTSGFRYQMVMAVDATPVPEPSTTALVLGGGIALAARKRVFSSGPV
ncbi:MAG: hypothetical protein C5B50_24055 [Verrucomicrobia bacterium]|nr:MAG: hypothetical protein C5B50_24055 [Verrucomicrobiota bacterium]